jgi:hypothetical protein
MSDSLGPSVEPETDVGGFIGPTSNNVAEILATAGKIAIHLSGDSWIGQRHLFAAFLTSGRGVAHQRISQMGIAISELSSRFFHYLEEYVADDPAAKWKEVLLGPKDTTLHDSAFSPIQRGPAGYTSEFCGLGGSAPVSDYLGVQEFAHRLAELIAL